MDLSKLKIKQGIAIITYAALLILLITQFQGIISGIMTLLGFFKPLFGGIGIAFVLNRPYEWLKKHLEEQLRIKAGIAGVLAAIMVYLLLFGGFITIILVVVPQLAQNIQTFAAGIDGVMDSVQLFFNNITDKMGIEAVDMTELISYVENYIVGIEQLIKDALPKIAVITMNAVSGVVNIFVATAFSVYLLVGKKQILSQLKRSAAILLPRKFYHNLQAVMSTIITVFDNYVAVQILEAVILGSLCYLGMLILRLDYAGMVSVVVAVSAMIPILGAYAGGGIGTVLLLCVSPKKAIFFLIFFILLQQVENNIIYPRVVGSKIGLPGIWVLLGITIGGKMMGIVGMLFGVPIMTIIYILLKNAVKNREERDISLTQEMKEG